MYFPFLILSHTKGLLFEAQRGEIFEVKILKEFIKTESHQLNVDQTKAPTAITNAVSWRPEGIKSSP